MNSLTTKVEQEQIQGKLIASSMDIDEAHLELTGVNYHNTIKRDLARELAQFMVENNMIQFVKTQLPNEHKVRISARVFVTPNDDVKTIRRMFVL